MMRLTQPQKVGTKTEISDGSVRGVCFVPLYICFLQNLGKNSEFPSHYIPRLSHHSDAAVAYLTFQFSHK